MKALTIWQPWASLIMIGSKPYEFRGWQPPRSLIGQRIVIHAATRPVKVKEVDWLLHQLETACGDGPCLHETIALPFLRKVKNQPGLLPVAHGLGTAILGEPKRGDLCAQEFGEAAGNDSDRNDHFNWGWPLTEVQAFEPPEPARGAQGFWNWSDRRG
jgi:hypothetical protein